jgi:DNA repair protein SbcD/Mre11
MKILHFADLHLGVETYGKINPETGVSTRLDDFLKAFDKLVDYALENQVDLVLFCGDAYKSREPNQTQQREFARRINRLAVAGIPIFLLIGNHDLPNAIGKATSTEIFQTLSIKNVYVSNRPEITLIETKSGPIQVASLPWLRRSMLLKKDEVKNMTLEQINQQMQLALTDTISYLAGKLDPSIPAVLAAHIAVATATVGSERLMAIGSDAFVLPGNIANPAFDYIALGHVHKRQVLSENPPVIYSGSLERVDFGEEADEKGFYVVDIGRDKKVTYEFHPVTGRSFLTITVKLEPGDTNPTETVLKAIRPAEAGESTDKCGVTDVIVRLQISASEEVAAQLRDNEIRDALKEAYFCTVAKDISKSAERQRFGQASIEEIPPLEALRTYLDANYTPERAKVLLEYGQKLIENQTGGDKYSEN